MVASAVGLLMLMVIASGALDLWAKLAILIGLVLLVGAFDWLIFKNLDSIAQHLDKSRLAVTEAIFGVAHLFSVWHIPFLYHFGTRASCQAVVSYSQLMQDRTDRAAQSRWLFPVVCWLPRKERAESRRYCPHRGG